MIHYHGGPIWPQTCAVQLWQRRHGLSSFARPEQTAIMAELCQSFCLDNGAFTLWKAGGGTVDVGAYADYVRPWEHHPGFDFAIIPDVIDGTEADNDRMIASWYGTGIPFNKCVPVWHLHEELARLTYLITCVRSGVYVRIHSTQRSSFAVASEPSPRTGRTSLSGCTSRTRPAVRC